MEVNQLIKIDNIKDEIECPVCLTHFDNKNHQPYLLKCGHNICQKNANTLTTANLFGDNHRITCPICKVCKRYDFDAEKQNIVLIKNFALTKIISILEKELNSPSQILIPIKSYLSQEYIDIVDQLIPPITSIQTWTKKIKKQLLSEENKQFYNGLQNWEDLEKKRSRFKKKRDLQVKHMKEAQNLLRQVMEQFIKAGYKDDNNSFNLLKKRNSPFEISKQPEKAVIKNQIVSKPIVNDKESKDQQKNQEGKRSKRKKAK